MQLELFKNFVDAISTLTLEQYETLSRAITDAQIGSSEAEESTGSATIESEYSSSTKNPTNDLETCILSQFAEQPICPKCQGCDIGRWGFQNERQRYRCKTCRVTFNAFSGTPLARLRNSLRVEEAVTDLNPHRAGRAQLTHPVPHNYWFTG